MSGAAPDHPRPVALVTGAARRIGRAVVLRFAAHGHDVLIHHRDSADEAERTAADARACGANARVLQADLTDAEESTALGLAALAAFGRLDVLVHNASRFERMDVRTAAPDAVLAGYDADQAVHVRAPLALTLQLAPALRAGSGGSVVCLGDAVLQRKGRVGYVVTKGALRLLMRSLSRELAPEIRVNMVSPGAVLPAADDAAAFERIVHAVPLARAGAPEEIAAAVHWLACEAGYVTGQDLAVDGGGVLERAESARPRGP